jgi:predicted  nucleic acid-binding Zn-ribbon protein
MSQLQAILNYQEIDKALYKLERELAGCEERKEYVKYKKFLETAPEKLDSLEVKATALKAESAELSKKYLQTEETLKEFENLDELITSGADITFYKKNVQTIVEQLKKIKADLNTLLTNIKGVDAEYQKLKKQVIAAQKLYREAADKYNAFKATKEDARKELETKLAEIAKDISAEAMEKYKSKRKEKIFPIVCQFNDKRCPFCGMDLPIVAVNQLTGGGMIECDSCHRIIYKE